MRKQFSAKTATPFSIDASDEVQKLVVDTARLKVEVPTPGGIEGYALYFSSAQPTEITVTKMAWGSNKTDDGQKTFFSVATGLTLAELNDNYGPDTMGFDGIFLATELEPCIYMTASSSDGAATHDVECVLHVYNALLPERAREAIDATRSTFSPRSARSFEILTNLIEQGAPPL